MRFLLLPRNDFGNSQILNDLVIAGSHFHNLAVPEALILVR